MSRYLDYDEVCNTYDEGRVADGADYMISMSAALVKKPISELRVLDAGCGTGNYGLAYLQAGVNNLTMVDACDCMLNEAVLKTKMFEDKVLLVKMMLPTVDFEESSFNVVSVTQVLHHIDSPKLKDAYDVSDYPNCVAAVKQFYKILEVGGVLIIDAMFEDNLDSIWWSTFCPRAFQLMCSLRIGKRNLFKLLRQCGYRNVAHVSRPGACLAQPYLYNSIDQVSNPRWRSYFSQYKLVETTGELQALIDIVDSQKNNMDKFRQDVFKKFRLHGDHSFVICQK